MITVAQERHLMDGQANIKQCVTVIKQQQKKNTAPFNNISRTTLCIRILSIKVVNLLQPTAI